MRSDTPPPDDNLSDGIPAGVDDDDVEILDDSDFEFIEEVVDEAIPVDFAQVTFKGHKGSVFCCDFAKNGELAITGAQDDKAYVWDTRTGSVVCQLNGHKDSVCESLFNFDSTLVVTGDMSGYLQVRSYSDLDVISWDFEIGEDLKFMQWHKNKNDLFVGAADGSCWLWELPDGKNVADVKMFHSFGTPVSCGQFMTDGSKLVVGYEDGSLRLWDNSANLLSTIEGSTAHSDTVTVTECHPTENLMLSGSVDGTAKLIKSSDLRVLFTLPCVPQDIEDKSVEGVGFFSNHPMFATGTVEGSIAIWDISTQVRRLQCEQEAGITQLICDSHRPMVYTSGIDGGVRLFDGRTGKEEMKWTGHVSAVLCFRISSCGNMILTASDDGSSKIFDIR